MSAEQGRLAGRVCVIAGVVGALGEGVAARFKQEGALVVGIDLKAHEVGELSLTLDLSSEAEVKDAYAQIEKAFGRVDVIYNNAGLTDVLDRSALETPVQVWSRVFAANLTTTWLSCKHGIPCMLRNTPPGGSVINTGSFLAGMGAASAQMAFSAAKAGVTQLSRDLAVNLARSGVRVNALSLGPIETPQLAAMFAGLGPEQTARRFGHMPMGRLGRIDELAATAVYLASDEAGFVTGSVFPINGGVPGAYTVP
jgi:NAD(P)-dependent dehydrogenase (short-subunit alcohol dehydrogenase family)